MKRNVHEVLFPLQGKTLFFPYKRFLRPNFELGSLPIEPATISWILNPHRIKK